MRWTLHPILLCCICYASYSPLVSAITAEEATQSCIKRGFSRSFCEDRYIDSPHLVFEAASPAEVAAAEAAAAEAAAAEAATKARQLGNIDVAGIRIGMTYKEVLAVAKRHYRKSRKLTVGMKPSYEFCVDPTLRKSCVTSFRFQYDPAPKRAINEEIISVRVEFVEDYKSNPGKSVVTEISFHHEFNADQITYDYTNLAISKYGKPQKQSGGFIYVWYASSPLGQTTLELMSGPYNQITLTADYKRVLESSWQSARDSSRASNDNHF